MWTRGPWCTRQKGKGSHPVDVALLVAAHALQDSPVQPQLQAGLVQHLPLVGVPGDQAVHLDGFGLADAVTPGLGLDVEEEEGGLG